MFKFFLLVATVAMVAFMTGCGAEHAMTIVPLDALSTFSVTDVNGVNTTCTELLAGQTIPAGTVCFEVAGSDLIVTYIMTGGWELTEAHLWVGCNAEGYPQTNKGNPKVGNFPYNSGEVTPTTEYSFVVPLEQFECLAEINCDLGNILYAMAHAAVQLPDGNGGYQTETGWADGDPTPGHNWATFVTLTLFDDSCGGPPPEMCWQGETAFAYDEIASTCFLDLDLGINRWGWSNGVYAASETGYVLEMWAGAGQCDTSKGTLVGTATLTYDPGTLMVTVVYNIDDPLYVLSETHAYVGLEILPRDHDGDLTVDPGQYRYATYGGQNEFDPDDGITADAYTFGPFAEDDMVYTVLHATVCTLIPCEQTEE